MTDRVLAIPGFTLLELVLVLAIIAVALAAVAPSLSGFGAGRKAQDAAAQFIAMTRLARSQAISDGAAYRIAIDVEAGRWWLQADDGAEFVDVGTPLGRAFNAPENVTLETDAPVAEDLRVIVFDAAGRSDVAAVRFIGPRGAVEVVCDAPFDEYHVRREAEVGL